jgi:CRP-like cAMP-binding protein
MSSRKFGSGTAIYRHGDEAGSAFEVRAGKVRLSWPDESGHTRTAVLGIGQIFGDAELIGGVPRNASAEAIGDVVVNEIGRSDLQRMFTDDIELPKTFLRPLFERLRREAELASRSAPAHPAPDIPAEVVIRSQLRLKPATRELYPQITEEGVRIASLPFRVGRRSTTPAVSGDGPIDLVLADRQPYSLSRRHFAIEARNGGYIVRDCGSHHGTIVNGIRIGGGATPSSAPLIAGDNRIVAGRSTSPFRFVLTIETS